MNARARFFALLTVVGFIVPNAFVVAYLVEHGFTPGDYLGDLVETLPAAQITADILIAAFAFLAWAFWEARRLRMTWWWTLPATGFIGICFAAPLFLYLRERRLEEAPAASGVTA